MAADGTPAKLYPLVWGPQHDFGLAAFSLLLAVGNGAGTNRRRAVLEQISRWT